MQLTWHQVQIDLLHLGYKEDEIIDALDALADSGCIDDSSEYYNIKEWEWLLDYLYQC